MKFPNFLLIGAAKSGTTSLSNYISQHPQIYLTPIKEPHFFAFEGQKVEFNGIGDRQTHTSIVTDIESYQKLYDDVSNEIAIGEASTTSISVPGSAQRIYAYIPSAKIIAILRHPADRAYSSFLHLRRDGREYIKAFEQALNEEEDRIEKNWGYLWRYKRTGLYYQQLKSYYKLFDRAQIKIYLYEDLKNTPVYLLKDLFSFLEVDITYEIDLSKKENVSGVPRSRLLHNLLHKKNFLRTALAPIVPSHFRKQIRKSNLVKPEISTDIRDDLTLFYKEEILKLQDLIQRDLSSWLS